MHVAFDVETTGLNYSTGHRIIEIGAVLISNGSILGQFSSLINPNKKISRNAQKIHKIKEEMLMDQPRPEEVYPKFEDFIKYSTLVAHNAPFDMAFLRQEFHLLHLDLNHPYVCTLDLSRRRFPHLANHKLSTVHRHLFGNQQNNFQAHRALDDARMVAAIWLAMEGK
ncbi:MAG: 3'-5' exonuclease [Syntrophales bacterium]|jgi:DNA polymerase III epsilon subunit family exonuclease|nr:3'-5' exonuclease [Syntrophales bacterium]